MKRKHAVSVAVPIKKVEHKGGEAWVIPMGKTPLRNSPINKSKIEKQLQKPGIQAKFWKILGY